MSKYIVLDLETIYLPEEGINKIIEIGFVVVHNNKTIKRYSRLINPGAEINSFVEQLTSITNEEVKNAPSFENVYLDFIPLFKDHILVAHQAELDMKTINDELSLLNLPPLENKTIDTVELSKILLPEIKSYKLIHLASSLEIKFDSTNAHRALGDAEVTTKVFLILKDRLLNLPKNSLLHLKQLTPYLISDLDDLFIKHSKKIDRTDIYSYFNDLPYKKPINFIKTKDNLVDYNLFIKNIYDEEGLLNRIFDNYIYRENQVKISNEIKDLFDENKNGLIEAATGIGKSIGYLIPVIYEAIKSGNKIVISTHTTQLQTQLMQQDIYKLKKVLPFNFNVQILKGKKNYIDIKRFYRFLKNKRNDTYPLVILKAKLIVWLTETNSGLFSDLNIEPNMEQFLFEIETVERNSQESFYNYALEKASTSDIVLVNHALLIADINTNESLIPSYNKIIIDEAHQFKNLMIENKNLLLTSSSFVPFLNYLIRSTNFYELHLLQKELVTMINKLFTYSEIESIPDQTYLFSSEKQSLNVKNIINEDFNTILGYFELSINKLENNVDKIFINQFLEYRERLENIVNNIENNLSFFITIEKDKNNLHWAMYSQVNLTDDNALTNFYKNKKSVVYLSATLTIRDNFNYMLEKLNLNSKTSAIKLETPFDLANQTKLIVPTDFPSIKDEEEYIAALSELVFSMNQSIKGGILILFTSYKMLKDTFYLLNEFLDKNTKLLAQGVTHNDREQLIYEFKTNQPAILLGTSSFWEGIDIKGDLLTCLIMTRLPFQQINHPTYKIEAERLENMKQNSFFDYALPEAVLKFRQGIGRLIRNESDKGFIFILDNRLKTSNYKKYFTESIYPITTNYYDTKKIIEVIDDQI